MYLLCHINKVWPVISIFFILYGCSAKYPKELHLDYKEVRVTYWYEAKGQYDFPENGNLIPTPVYASDHTTDFKQPILAILFKANGPFSFIKQKGVISSFTCKVFKNKNTEYDDEEWGSIYFINENNIANNFIKKNKNKNIIEVGDAFSNSSLDLNCRKCRYVAYVFDNLKHNIGGEPPKKIIDLISGLYQNIKCRLRGLDLYKPALYSNEIIISKKDIIKMHNKFTPSSN